MLSLRPCSRIQIASLPSYHCIRRLLRAETAQRRALVKSSQPPPALSANEDADQQSRACDECDRVPRSGANVAIAISDCLLSRLHRVLYSHTQETYLRTARVSQSFYKSFHIAE